MTFSNSLTTSHSLRLLLTYRLRKITETLPGHHSTPTGKKSGKLLSSCHGLPDSIPLKRMQTPDGIEYRSAIALRLASQCELSPMTIAEAIAAEWRQQIERSLIPSATEPFNSLEAHLTVLSLAPGLVQIRLNSVGEAEWLQHWSNFLPELGLEKVDSEATENNRNFGLRNFTETPSQSRDLTRTSRLPRESTGLEKNLPQLFMIQHSHARCSSLLFQAEQTGLIRLSKHLPATIGRILAPQPIPWLMANGHLGLCHPTERALIAQIVALTDESATVMDGMQAFKLAQMLSQAFQAFQAQCQIFGAYRNANLELAQARLGLVLIVQACLKLLLEKHLKIVAPTAL